MGEGSRTRVMFVAPCFGYGGLERVMLDIMSDIDRTRFAPSFCALLTPEGEMSGRLERLDIPVHVMDKGEGISWSLVFRLARLMRRERIDLVNSHDIGATLYAAPAARLAGIEAVVHTDHSQILTKTRLLPVLRWILQHLVKGSVTVSRELERYLADEMRVDQARIVTIPNGIKAARFEIAVDGRPLREELGIPEGSSVIGTIGRLTEQKGMKYLIDSFTGISRRYPGSVLVLVGDGDLRPELEDQAVRSGLGERVIFTGIREDIPELMGIFDIFVLPSLWEGQPVTIMEAMASGRPIIATDVGGTGEILRSGDFGVLVPAGDPDAIEKAVVRLLGDRGSAKELGERARRHAAAELDSAVMTRRYEEFFTACIDPRRDRR